MTDDTTTEIPVTADVVVIGGGAIGTAVAHAIRVADPSVDVVVIERDPAYTLASTPRAAGGVRRLFSLPENIELSNYSIPVFEHFDTIMAVDGESPLQLQPWACQLQPWACQLQRWACQLQLQLQLQRWALPTPTWAFDPRFGAEASGLELQVPSVGVGVGVVRSRDEVA